MPTCQEEQFNQWSCNKSDAKPLLPVSVATIVLNATWPHPTGPYDVAATSRYCHVTDCQPSNMAAVQRRLACQTGREKTD